tara:strand:+ start:108 stop:758 length:651 start_codon:yes stop_codon:yes gene_type:complete
MDLQPKCMLERNAKPLLFWQLRALLDDTLATEGVANIVVVLGHYAEQIVPWIDELSVTTVRQTDVNHSMDDSINLGVRALSDTDDQGVCRLKASLDAVMICPTDLPLLRAEDYRAVIAAFWQRPSEAHFLCPLVNKVPGHPVMFDRTVADVILTEGSGLSPRQWRTQNLAQVCEWVTDNAHYVWDVDSVEDIRRLAASTGIELKSMSDGCTEPTNS